MTILLFRSKKPRWTTPGHTIDPLCAQRQIQEENPLTMNLTSTSTASSSSRRQPACPCCVFLNEDLFLPTTDTPPSTDAVASNNSVGPNGEVVSPQEALKILQRHAETLTQNNEKPSILLVDTHNHAHLNREKHGSYHRDDETPTTTLAVVSLTLAVDPNDWDNALKYSANINKSDLTLMGLGIHPWYLSDTVEPNGPWKQRLEELLEQHPSAIVGEIGLCKMAKCARDHPEGKTKGFEIQRTVLEEQLQVATRYNRPVSIHCVQQHGVFLDMLKELLTKEESTNLVPPAMAMHSFTGTAHHIKRLLQWEASLFGEGPNDKKKKKKHQSTTPVTPTPTRPPLLYFGFSHIVNYEMCTSDKARRQGREAARAVPLNRLLAESDVHHPDDVATGTAGAIAYLAWALEEPITRIAEITAKNGLAFLQSHLDNNTKQSN